MQFVVVAGLALIVSKLAGASAETFKELGYGPKPTTIDINTGRGKFDPSSGYTGTGTQPSFAPAKVETFYGSENVLNPLVSLYHPDSGKNSDGYGLRPRIDHLYTDSTGTQDFSLPNEIFKARHTRKSNLGRFRR